MRFRQFLLETRTRKAVSASDAAKWIAKNAPKYWDALMEKSTQPIYRGESGFDDDIVISNSGTGRKSLTGPNYITLLVDSSSEWKDYPKRSESFICSTSYSYASEFGPSKYIMIPTDDTMVAVAPKDDFWYSFNVAENLNDRSNYRFTVDTLNTAMRAIILLHKNISTGVEVSRGTILNGDEVMSSASTLMRTLDDAQKFLEEFCHVADFPAGFKFGSFTDLLAAGHKFKWDEADIDRIENLKHDINSGEMNRAMALLFAARGEKMSKFVQSLLDPKDNSIELIEASDGFDNKFNKEVWFSGEALMIYRHGNIEKYQDVIDSINEELNK